VVILIGNARSEDLSYFCLNGLKEVQSLSFSSTCRTQVIGSYQGVENGVQLKSIEYQTLLGTGAESLIACHIKTVSIHNQVIEDRTKIFTPQQKMWFSGIGRRLTVGKVVPGSDKFLDNICGIFLPMRCLIELKDGRPVDVDGFIPSLNHWTDRKWIEAKVSALARFDSKDDHGLLIWRTVVDKSVKAGPKDSFYIVRVDPSKRQIVSWDYHQAGVLKETWNALTWQDVNGVPWLQTSEMTHFVEGAAFSKSKIEVSNIRINFEPDMSVFEFDPAEADTIYDRDAKALIKVPK
jgi:hypothetical protein